MPIAHIMGRKADTNVASKPAPPSYPTPRPQPATPPGPHQLGRATLQNVDQITSMSAEQIERVADQLEEAAHDTAAILREAARRIRDTGLVANERLANFVRVASTCAEAAALMGQSVERRDDPKPTAPEATAIELTPIAEPAREPVNLDELAEIIATERGEQQS